MQHITLSLSVPCVPGTVLRALQFAGVRLLPFCLCIPESPPSDIVDPQRAMTELKCCR